MIPRRSALAALAASFLSAAAVPGAARAQAPDTALAATRPSVPGGYDDKPYLTGIFGRIAVGGYAEFHGTWERTDGATEEGGFQLKRWNLLTHTRVSRAIEVWAEVEFEDGGEEVVLELAQLDYQAHAALGLRVGMLLLPIGRFNLAHDGPRNEFTDRPLIATDVLGSALSMPGLGLFGHVPAAPGRVTYEAYAVNGYHDGIISASGDGTRLPAGSESPEDNNVSPAWVGRLAWDAGDAFEAGLSGYGGDYNVSEVEGMVVDERRAVRIGAVDLRGRVLGLAWNGEGTLVSVDVPPGLVGLYAGRQSGFFIETSRVFGTGWIEAHPEASFGVAARIEGVDFDRDLAGDSIQRLTLGARFRPTVESVFKLDYRRGRSRDRFNNAVEEAAVLFSLATYF